MGGGAEEVEVRRQRREWGVGAGRGRRAQQRGVGAAERIGRRRLPWRIVAGLLLRR